MNTKVASAVLLASLLAAGPVLAEDTAPAASEADVQRLSAELHAGAERARENRTASGVVNLVAGAVLLPTGIALRVRADDDVAHSIGIGLTSSGASALLLAGLSLHQSKMESLDDAFRARRDSGMAASEVIAETEADLRAAAAASADRRAALGVVEVVAGSVLTAAGLSMYLAPKGALGMDRNTQYSVGSLLVGPGIPLTSLGVHTLLVKSPEETAWQAHHDGTVPQPAVKVQSVGVTPTQGGAALIATVSF
jgi:hypothetical protein